MAALPTVPLLGAGAWIGGWCYRTIARPERSRVWLELAAGIALPFAAGAVDLYLRAVTP
jgi:hypothetical protein